MRAEATMRKNIYHLVIDGTLDGEAILSKMVGNAEAVKVNYCNGRTVVCDMTSSQSINLIAYCQWCGAKILDVRTEEVA